MTLEKAGQQQHEFLLRHMQGEWGNVPAEDSLKTSTASDTDSGC